MVPAQHELQQPVGQVQDAPGPAAPQHQQLNARPDAHRLQPLAQIGMAGQTDDPHAVAGRNIVERLGRRQGGHRR